MDFFEQIYRKRNVFVDVFGFVNYQVRKRLAVYKLKYAAVAFSDPDDIIGDGSRDPENECFSGQLPLSLYLGESIRVLIDLNDGFVVYPVHLTVGTSA